MEDLKDLYWTWTHRCRLTSLARGSRRHPFAAFTAMLKTVQARDASDVGHAVRQGLQVLNLHKLCSGADTYGQGYTAHAVEPCLLVLLTDGCDMAHLSLEPEVRSSVSTPCSNRLGGGGWLPSSQIGLRSDRQGVESRVQGLRQALFWQMPLLMCLRGFCCEGATPADLTPPPLLSTPSLHASCPSSLPRLRVTLSVQWTFSSDSREREGQKPCLKHFHSFPSVLSLSPHS